jgi:capsular polysaccharide biosynthesis protein
MRKAEFEVPQEAMTEFADELTNRNLNNTITGTTEDGEIIIEVEYDKDESDEVDE